jgi:hypothetical protein
VCKTILRTKKEGAADMGRSSSPYKYQEAPQAHAQEEAQEDAEGHPLATTGRQVTL